MVKRQRADMKDKKMTADIDLETVLKKGSLSTEIEHERAIVLQRQLRLLEKEHPELGVKRKELRTLIKGYEDKYWTGENISEELIVKSDAAEILVEKERQFLARRKDLIRVKLKELSLSQKQFGIILGHSSATYVSELINGICAFSIRDLVLIHAMLKIDFNDLIPTSAIETEKEKVVATVHEVKPNLKINEDTLELVCA